MSLSMHCRDCPRWIDGKCADQKVNPERYGQAVEVANIHGVRAICPFNEHRDRLVRTRTIQAIKSPDRRKANRGDLKQD